ncbi:hypothetical protein [Micromonospora aurantiaca (nom. illeg.)]|uniref:hypothetical protein n=1 Tax=Micromonospora aurantiaca (nom. illeg.) TaxID=47850 RepID=UPI0008294312|nr:hypothetical protein [Micromonospora aurantiaca]SCL21136.1 hypothetical protein GA0070615_0002 [Micromonospora aurantiaca]
MPGPLYTAEEVLAVATAAYLRGRYDRDVLELRGTWAEHDEPRATRERLIAERLAEMDQAARTRAAREGRTYRPYPGGPVDWHTGDPVAPTTTEVDHR